MELKDRIKEKRIEKGYTLEELAHKVHTTKQNIHRYESGVIANIPSDKIEMLAAALDTTPAYLMGWDEPVTTDELALYLLTREGLETALFNTLGYTTEKSADVTKIISKDSVKEISNDALDGLVTDCISFFDFALSKELKEA